MLFAIMLMMAEVPLALYSKRTGHLNMADSLGADTLLIPGQEAAIKLKRDTSTMDSIELAIYKHNKAVDDSLAQDSINKSRKNGIDSPVDYSANDSLTYGSRGGSYLHESRQQSGTCQLSYRYDHEQTHRFSCI